VSAPLTPEDVKAQYGFVAALAGAIPEVGQLMQQAVAEKWTAQRFQMAIANTGWWKTTPAQTRQWVTMQYADPASATREMQTGGDQVKNMANKYGFNLNDPARAQQLWLNAKLAGYDDRMTELYVFNDLQTFRPGTPQQGGELGLRMLAAKRLASDYGYSSPNLDQEVIDDMARSISMNQDQSQGMAAWQQKMQQYAQAKYTPFADRIAGGSTVRDIAQPYVDVMRQELELPDVDLSDQYIQRWLQGQSVDGQPPAATAVWQAQRELRTDPRWQYTRNAWNAVADVANTVGRAFGMQG
jgi:hypothetical protein